MRSASPSASPGSRRSASSTTCSPTGPSSSSAAPPQPSSRRSTTCAATRRSPAPHLVANALAAAALARAHGVPAGAVRAGLRAFVPEPHRIAEVGTVDGVRWVDDSKATNPHAARASLAAYEHVVWVAGGLLKGADVDDLVAGAADRLRGVVLIGARPRARSPRHSPDTRRMSPSSTSTAPTLEPWTWW